jgi:hypothetical protein
MGSKRSAVHRLETAATFRFSEPNFDESPTHGFDGVLTTEQLEWLVDKLADTTEYDAVRRAGKSIRSFHEHHIAASAQHGPRGSSSHRGRVSPPARSHPGCSTVLNSTLAPSRNACTPSQAARCRPPREGG